LAGGERQDFGLQQQAGPAGMSYRPNIMNATASTFTKNELSLSNESAP
jgi:hypothetical protein